MRYLISFLFGVIITIVFTSTILPPTIEKAHYAGWVQGVEMHDAWIGMQN